MHGISCSLFRFIYAGCTYDHWLIFCCTSQTSTELKDLERELLLAAADIPNQTKSSVVRPQILFFISLKIL